MKHSGASGKGARRKSVSKPAKTSKTVKPSRPVARKLITSKAVQAQLAAQREAQRIKRKQKIERVRAEKLLKRFRPRKSDRGQIIFVETSGKRDSSKGRKGVLVWVGKRGKKTLLKDPKQGFRPQQKSKLTVPFTKETAAAAKEYAEAKLTNQVLGSGQVQTGGAWEFNDSVIGKLARGITKTINAQTGFRDFTLKCMVLVEVPGLGNRVYEINASIQKPQGVKIPASHMESFLPKEFWLLLARQLAFDGYVTNGSANHVRVLKENKGKDRDEWTKDGIPWESRHDTTQVTLRQIDWQMIQNRQMPKKRKKRK